MFRDWDNFYIIIGPTAGALIGAMFVVATLTAGLDETRRRHGSQIYITPVVFHLTIVVIVSAISAVPELPPAAIGGLLTINAVIGLVYSTMTMIRVFTVKIQEATDWSDKSFYGILPVIVYLGLMGATASIWLAPSDAAYAIGAVMVAILLLGVRNSWDLVTYLVQRPGGSAA